MTVTFGPRLYSGHTMPPIPPSKINKTVSPIKIINNQIVNKNKKLTINAHTNKISPSSPISPSANSMQISKLITPNHYKVLQDNVGDYDNHVVDNHNDSIPKSSSQEPFDTTIPSLKNNFTSTYFH